MKQSIVFRVGQPYPLPITLDKEAVIHFFTNERSFLQIMVQDLFDAERYSFNTCEVSVGIIIEQSMILFLIEVKDLDLIFECFFDIRLISFEERQLENVANKQEFFLLDIHVVDIKTKKLEVLRTIALTPELTKKIYDTVKIKIIFPDGFEKIHEKYAHMNMLELARKAHMSVCKDYK